MYRCHACKEVFHYIDIIIILFKIFFLISRFPYGTHAIIIHSEPPYNLYIYIPGYIDVSEYIV